MHACIRVPASICVCPCMHAVLCLFVRCCVCLCLCVCPRVHECIFAFASACKCLTAPYYTLGWVNTIPLAPAPCRTAGLPPDWTVAWGPVRISACEWPRPCFVITLCVGQLPSLRNASEAVPNEKDLALSGQQRQGVGGQDWHRKVGWPGSAALLGRPSLEHRMLRLGFFRSPDASQV